MNIKITKFRAIAVALGIMLVITASAIAGKPDWWSDQEKTSNDIAAQMVTATPYPISQMKFSLERSNVKNRLLRMNNPNKIGYVYLMSFGKFVGYYTIKGKVSSTQSELTNTEQTWQEGGGNEANDTVASSIGDDGTFGPEEGGEDGVFFFTVNKVLVETTLQWIYSDAPLNIDVPNLVNKANKTAQ